MHFKCKHMCWFVPGGRKKENYSILNPLSPSLYSLCALQCCCCFARKGFCLERRRKLRLNCVLLTSFDEYFRINCTKVTVQQLQLWRWYRKKWRHKMDDKRKKISEQSPAEQKYRIILFYVAKSELECIHTHQLLIAEKRWIGVSQFY